MDLFEPQLVVKKEVRFTEAFTESTSNGDENFGDVFGGIIRSGQWSWLTKGSRLHIMSIRTGQLITKFDFDDSTGFGVCIITCVSEVNLPFVPDAIIAIGLQYVESPGGVIVLYSVEESTVLRCIELKHKITCCKFISHEVSQHCVTQNMSGCLAVGTDGGNVLLVDLNLRGDELNSALMDSGVSVVPCHIVDHNMSLLHLQRHFQHCQQEGVHFGIQLEAPENADFVQSLLPIDIILGLAAGLGDGRLVLYDLTDMLIFFVVPPQERSSPLVKMSFMEPPDDPRPCVYIWAFHENSQNSKAVLHSLMYEKRVVVDDGFCYFENFQVSSVRLLLPLNSPKSVPVTCQTIFKPPSHGNDETISLCALVWKHEREKQTEVLLFDINQWYKEEMPYVGDWRDEPSYLASFVLPGMNIIEFFFNPKTTSLFNSIQRSEEHFYPVSLSFDCVALGETGCFHLNWPGVQNRVINVLRSKGSLALLDPNPVFLEILNTRLLPQFSKLNYSSTFSLKAKRETLLSVALEQNCIGLLKECAKNWSDGSHQGTSLLEALSLSTLTDWMWSRASSIKERCNKLCQVLFDHSGCILDQREQKELGYISKQLKTLADLLGEITTKYKQTIPSDVLNTLQTQAKSIQLASDYQEILLWLLNIGLLPEASRPSKYREIELNLVPYPYESLQRFYTTRRKDFTRLNEKFASRKTGSCFLLFIDSFIEHEFKGNSLRDSWQETGGDGLYPPTSIQAMLRTMLSPDVSFDNKCALFLYFFLDLNMAIEDKRYEPIVQNFIKFPSVFRLSASLIKQIQAFWNLDHCRFPAAVDEFISPFNRDHVCPQWQLELFIESLLAQREANLALRVLEAKSSPISPVLQLNTYLANDLISEAFHFARSKQDEDLLKLFFTGCLCTGKFGVIRDLALTESEGALVQSILKNSKSRNAENLHFVYLLQKYKYIEAVSYLDDLSKGRVAQRAVDVDTPTLVLSAYNATMTPVTKGLSDVYFKIKNKIKSREAEQNSPYPLSCQLIKQNANDLLGGIYHSSALSTHFASQYWERHHSEANALQQSKNAPFLRRPQVQASYADIRKKNISYPDPYEAAQKRRLDQNSADEDRSSKVRENPRKRRKMYDLSNLEAIYKPLRELSSTESMMASTKSEPRQVRSQTKYAKSPPGDTSLLLETPYFKKSTEDNPDSGEGTGSEKPAISLHGILKGTQKSPTEDTDTLTRGVSVESDKKEKREAEEEKSIRFVLPTIEDESDEQMDVQDSKTDDSEDKDLMEASSLRRCEGPSKRKALRSAPVPATAAPVGNRKLSLRNSSSEEPEQPILRESTKKAVYVEEDSGDSFVNQPHMSVAAEGLAQDSKCVAAEKYISEKEPTSTETAEKEQPRAQKVTLSRPAIVRSRTPLRAARSAESKELTEALEAPKAFFKASASLGTVASSHSLPQRAAKAAESRELPAAPKVFSKVSASVDTVVSSVSLTRASVRQTLEKVQSDDLAEQPPEKLTSAPDDSTGNVRIIPIVVIDENRRSPTDKQLNTTTLIKNPKRALSESSDDQATETLQRSAKQLKGRASIHSSSSESGENKAPPTTTDLKEPAKSIALRTETMVGFEPHVSSSRVCATESRFRFAIGDSFKTSVTTGNKISKETFAEQSTVVGGLTYLPTLEASEQVTETISVTVPTGQRMMDTTVDMTMYDTMAFEHSNPPPSSESSNSANAPTHGRYMDEEEDYSNSDFNARNEYEPQSKEEHDDNDSVILLSSRSSSSSTYYGDAMEDGKAIAPTSRQIIIDDEDDDSDGVDIIERYGAGSDPSNSYSNQFSEVTRTSTSCSLESNCIAIDDVENTTSITSYKEVETGEDYEERSKDYHSRVMAPIREEEVMETLTVEEDSEDNDESKEAPPEAVVVPVNESKIGSSEGEKEEIKDTPPETEVVTLASPEAIAEEKEQDKDVQMGSVSRPAVGKEEDKDEQVESVSDAQTESAESSSKAAVVIEAVTPEKVVEIVAEERVTSETEIPQAVTEKVKESETPTEDGKKMEETKTVPEEAEKVLEKMDEVENVVKENPSVADQSTPNEAEESHTPKVGRRRSSSFSKANTTASDITDSPFKRRNSRGGSMPPASASQIVTRRRSMLLEKLEEQPTPDSPSSRTRSRLRVDSIDGELESPSVSSVKRTRLSSISSVTSADNPQTPKSRRRSSMSVDKEPTTAPKTPRTARGRSVTAEEASTPIKTPRRLSISKREKTSPNQSILEDEPQENPEKGPEPTRTDDFMASRRLTRTQLATLEKSAALEKQFAQSPVRVTRRSTSRASEKESPPDVKGSDTESISSRTSHLSNASRRITRSSALKENVDDDVGSVASSTESGKKRKKRGKEATSPIILSAIPEEDPSGSEKSLPASEASKKSRRPKK